MRAQTPQPERGAGPFRWVTYPPYLIAMPGLVVVEFLPPLVSEVEGLYARFGFHIYDTPDQRDFVTAKLATARTARDYNALQAEMQRRPTTIDGPLNVMCYQPPIAGWPYFVVTRFPSEVARHLNASDLNRGAYTVEIFAAESEATDFMAKTAKMLASAIGVMPTFLCPEGISPAGNA